MQGIVNDLKMICHMCKFKFINRYFFVVFTLGFLDLYKVLNGSIKIMDIFKESLIYVLGFDLYN